MIKTINHNKVSVLEMTGSDVTTFLNNQVLTELKPNTNKLVFTAICNPKGRILFTLFMSTQSDTTYVAVDATLCDNFLQYVNMRRFRMDVKINKSNYLLGFNVTTDHPQLNNDVVLTSVTKPDSASTDEFWLFMFKIGLPWMTSQSSEHFIPQHLNLDQSKVIDFDKGCYPGQEIVARLHFLGKVKKRMQYIQYQSEYPYDINTKPDLSGYDSQVEICSPAIKHNNWWHSQAIVTC